LAAEAEQFALEREAAVHAPKKIGRPKMYNKSHLPKTYQIPLSNSTAAYSNARQKLSVEVVKTAFSCSADFGDSDKESWHGMKTFISDGTYLQLQDSEDIRKAFAVKNMEDSYPQALLQVMIRQGSGQISQMALSNTRSRSTRSVPIAVIDRYRKIYDRPVVL
jgi:hypothetical protein